MLPGYQKAQKEIFPNTKSLIRTVGFEAFRGKRFYCGKDIEDDCFNHIIKMPIKNNRIHQLYDYQRDIFNLLQKGEKYLWICKAGGLGISELFLRYISWKCLFNDDWKNCRVVIVTGPRMELSITLIDRMKKFFIDLGMSFSTDQTTIELNGCRIQSYPSHHVSTMRGLTDVKMIMIDEAAFFPKGEQWEVRDAAERYIAKSDPIIVMVSTPNLPSGMFFDISQEP